MKRLSKDERSQIVKAFLMVTGGIALAMVAFALVGALVPMTVVLVAVGMGLVLTSLVPRKWASNTRRGLAAAGLAVIAGALGGCFIINMVTTQAFL